jgi:hypothetical protein
MRTITTATLMLTASLAYAQDFRSASFGMSREEVRATETAVEWIDQSGVLGFQTSISGLQALAVYHFVNDKFSRANYSVTEPHSNRNAHIDDYRKLAGLLEQKYGAPAQDETVWRNDLYRDDPSGWGTAIAAGHMTMYKSWEADTASVIILLNGDNFDMNLLIEYSNNDLAEEERQQTQQNALDAL